MHQYIFITQKDSQHTFGDLKMTIKNDFRSLVVISENTSKLI